MIITIDGPAGTGKSTAARNLAAKLRIAYLDTGAMYRAIALHAMRHDLELEDEQAVSRFARDVDLSVDCGSSNTRVFIDGRDVTEAIRSIEVGAATSRIARHQPVRDCLVDMQRNLGAKLKDFVAEGRDQGSVVFPNADFRFILTASVEVRAKRRHQEMVDDGQDVDLQTVAESIRARDAIDSKQWEPLLQSGQGIVVDTSALSVDDVVDHLHSIVTGGAETP